MELTPDQIEEIEEKLEQLSQIDPADLPEPAAELATILGRLLEGTEGPD